MTGGASRAAEVASRPTTPSGIAVRRFPFCRLVLCRGALLGAAGLGLAACGGGVPLFHPAHVMKPGDTSFGAGVSGQIALAKLPSSPTSEEATLQDRTVSPQIAPWVAARIGIAFDNEAGLSYSGRTIRLDGRHAFSLGGPALSVGLGASALVGAPITSSPDPSGLFGGGLDIPVLLGFRSTSDIYSLWFGPRTGVEFLSGTSPGLISARHVYAGLTAGFKVGFRHVNVAFELNGSYHRSDGLFGERALGQNQVTLTPGGALLFSF
jgi:hypothetical protein